MAEQFCKTSHYLAEHPILTYHIFFAIIPILPPLLLLPWVPSYFDQFLPILPNLPLLLLLPEVLNFLDQIFTILPILPIFLLLQGVMTYLDKLFQSYLSTLIMRGPEIFGVNFTFLTYLTLHYLSQFYHRSSTFL